MPTYAAPRTRRTGFTARHPQQYAANGGDQGIYDALVVPFNWRDLFPTNATTMDVTERNRITAAIADAAGRIGPSGLATKVVLRPLTGFNAPAWAKAAAGSVRWYTQDGLVNIDPAELGSAPPSAPGSAFREFLPGEHCYWNATGRSQLVQMYTQVATQWAATTAVAEIDLSGFAMTQYGEPLVLQAGCDENVDALFNGGWTEALQQTALEAGWQHGFDVWGTQYGVPGFTAYNPAMKFSTGGTGSSGMRYSGTNMARTKMLMGRQATILKDFAHIGNESYDGHHDTSPTTSDFESQMWNSMEACDYGGHAQNPIQTSTLAKHIAAGLTVKQTIDAAIAAGWLALELPTGCTMSDRGADQITPAYAAAKSPQLKYSTARDGSVMSGFVGTVKGSTGSVANTTFPVVLPASIPAGSLLDLTVIAGSNVNLVSITGVAGTQTPLGGNPDANGTNLPGWRRTIAVGPADNGATLTVTISGTARAAAIGVVLSGVQTPSSGAATVTTAGSTAVMPTVPDQGGYSVEILAARAATGDAPVITLPGAYAVDDSVGTTMPNTTINVSMAIGVDAGTGGGTGGGTATTATPAADKVTGWSVSYAPALTSVVSTRTASWATRAATTSARAASWTTRAAALSTRVATWVTIASVPSTRVAAWAVRTTALTTRAASWAVLTSTASSRTATWGTAAAVTATRQAVWAALTAVTSTRIGTWATRALATATAAAIWATRSSTTSQRTLAWATTSIALSTRSASWSTSQVVVSTRTASWSTAGSLTSVISTRTCLWTTSTSTTTSAVASWSTRAATTSTRSTTWATTQTVTSSRTTSWATAGSLTSVTSTRTTTWVVNAAVISTRTASWAARAATVTAAAASWVVRALAVATGAASWTTRASVPVPTTARWDVLQTVTASRLVGWDVEPPDGTAVQGRPRLELEVPQNVLELDTDNQLLEVAT